MDRRHRIVTLSRLCGLALMALAGLSGCAARDVMATDSSGYVVDAGQRVAAVDWDTAETVDVALSAYEFAPSALRFRQGRPYRLHLTNHGFEVHDFSSKAFFQAIAAAKLVDSGTTSSLPRLVTIGIDPGASKDLYFVPVQPGSYSFECDEPLHAAFGMSGVAEIE